MERELKILMLEDLSSDAELIKRCLAISNIKFKVKVVYKRDEFINALYEFGPDIILSDHQLPQFDSWEALKILQEKNINIPFILVTGTVSEEFAVTIIKEGADDYILKSNLTRLPNAIKSALQKKKTEREKENYQKQLENKINEINTLIYRISHDLRAPLASTFGIIKIIRKNVKDEFFLGYIDMIEKSNGKMESILMSFADVIMISEKNKTEEKFYFKEIIEDLVQNMQNIPQAGGINFNIAVNPNIGFFGNKPMMVSVLQNLIYNSIIYRKGITGSYIKVEVLEEKNRITIEVSDNGIGIETVLQPKIFDMFYRATIASNGSGLGLYIVKNAVEKFGGTILMQSVQGEGTTFKIVFPKK